MRQIVLDTETTGLEAHNGHRLIEIGAVELIERRPSGKTFHTYLNPERAIDEGARAVTGIEDEFLLDKPKFADVVVDFLAFVAGAELIIHNASFDIGFLDAELKRAGEQYGRMHDHASVLDTLLMARERYPGQRNSLDALCKRLGVDNTHRDLHGGLELAFEQEATPSADALLASIRVTVRPRVLRASDAELAAHMARLDALDKAAGTSMWRKMEAV